MALKRTCRRCGTILGICACVIFGEAPKSPPIDYHIEFESRVVSSQLSTNVRSFASSSSDGLAITGDIFTLSTHSSDTS